MAELACTTKDRQTYHVRHLRWWEFLQRVAGPIFRRYFGFTHDDFTGIEGPYLVLSNHNTNLDPAFVGMAIRKHAYFVASEHVLRGGLASKLLVHVFCPIIHQKGAQGLRTAKEMHQTLKGGQSVVLFPEGNRSFTGLTMDIPPVTAKMAKKAGKLVTMRLEGGYLTQPRWSMQMRRGKMHATLMNVYDAEAMAAMTDAELLDAIKADLYEDAFARQETIAAAEGSAHEFTRGCKDLALGVESTLFLCPECERLGTLRSEGCTLGCTDPDCGFIATYTSTGFFAAPDAVAGEGGAAADAATCLAPRFTTVAAWDAWEHQELRRRIREEAGTFAMEDQCTLRLIGDEHAAVAESPVTLRYADGAFSVTPQEPFSEFVAGETVPVTMADISGVAMTGRNTVIVHAGNPAKHYEITGGVSFNGLKYVYVFSELSERNAHQQ